MSDFYVEWASTVMNRKGRMLPLKSIETILKLRDPGYASVYMFDQEASDQIKLQGHSKGLNRFAVAAKHLILDIDTGEDALKKAEDVLKKHNLSYTVWSSGGKGYHVYIPHEFLLSKDLPSRHRTTALSLFPKDILDLTLYQHGRLLSLPGRVHPKTKKKKTLLRSVEGGLLTLKEAQFVAPDMSKFYATPETEAERLSVALSRASDLIGCPPITGKRHIRLWGLSKDFCLAGLSFDTVLDIITQVNNTWTNQKTSTELRQVVSRAFEQSGLPLEPKSELE